MNYSELIVPAAIIIYAVFEFQRREQLHRERMELLRRNMEPPLNRRTPTIATIISTASVALLLAGMIILFFFIVSARHFRDFGFILLPALFIVLLIFLILILIRDIKIYRANNKS